MFGLRTRIALADRPAIMFLIRITDRLASGAPAFEPTAAIRTCPGCCGRPDA
ncbi:MAG TPA: hypothetical protein VHT91_19715 [Kofleriaceae bacterium]|jgi:hypothetical protein|nr:hypothetical protein [Kofleriaceae bacterium]